MKAIDVFCCIRNDDISYIPYLHKSRKELRGSMVSFVLSWTDCNTRKQCGKWCVGETLPYQTTINMLWYLFISSTVQLAYIWVCCVVPRCLYCIILYYTVLYYTVLYYTILYCTVLYYTVLYYKIQYCTVRYYTVLYYTVLCYTILYCTILYHTVLYCTILYYTTWYCTVLYSTV